VVQVKEKQQDHQAQDFCGLPLKLPEAQFSFFSEVHYTLADVPV